MNALIATILALPFLYLLWRCCKSRELRKWLRVVWVDEVAEKERYEAGGGR